MEASPVQVKACASRAPSRATRTSPGRGRPNARTVQLAAKIATMAQKEVNDMAASVIAPAKRTARNMSTSSAPETKPERTAAARSVLAPKHATGSGAGTAAALRFGVVARGVGPIETGDAARVRESRKNASASDALTPTSRNEARVWPSAGSSANSETSTPEQAPRVFQPYSSEGNEPRSRKA